MSDPIGAPSPFGHSRNVVSPELGNEKTSPTVFRNCCAGRVEHTRSLWHPPAIAHRKRLQTHPRRTIYLFGRESRKRC